jgi:hypothetical protein
MLLLVVAFAAVSGFGRRYVPNTDRAEADEEIGTA